MSSKITPKKKPAAKKVKKRAAGGSKKRLQLIIACTVLVAAGLAAILLTQCNKTSETGYSAVIEVKDYGTIVVELDHDAAPVTVDNFVKLAKSGFYDGLTFHRIMKGFMIQGGDPDHNGTGGSDQTIYGEFFNNGYDNPLSHTRGTISMARNSVDMNSASSQFFLMHEDRASLDGSYAAFGHVISGMEVVDAIANDARPYDNNGSIVFEEQPVITRITVTVP